MPERIYSSSEVAALFGVTPSAVSQWRARYTDTPAPDFITNVDIPYWSDKSVVAWIEWHTRMSRTSKIRNRT